MSAGLRPAEGTLRALTRALRAALRAGSVVAFLFPRAGSATVCPFPATGSPRAPPVLPLRTAGPAGGGSPPLSLPLPSPSAGGGVGGPRGVGEQLPRPVERRWVGGRPRSGPFPSPRCPGGLRRLPRLLRRAVPGRGAAKRAGLRLGGLAHPASPERVGAGLGYNQQAHEGGPGEVNNAPVSCFPIFYVPSPIIDMICGVFFFI